MAAGGATEAEAAPLVGGSPVCHPMGGSDVLFILDNSASIDAAEYTSYAAMVASVGEALRAANPSTRIGVAHYGGTYGGPDFGQRVYFERDFSTAALSSPVRRFGTGSLISDNMAGAIYQASYGLDANAATTSSYIVSPLTEMSRDLTRPLQIVVFTDSVREGTLSGSNRGSALIDGVGYAYEPNDGSSFTIYNLLKAQGVSFSVWASPPHNNDPLAPPAAAAVASVGGSWVGSVEANAMDPEGSQTTPRRLVTSSVFSMTAEQILDFITPIQNVCPYPRDYGDAPASYGAPSHDVAAGGPQLGAAGPDLEAGARHSADALGDDLHGADDEDGIAFWGMEVGQTGVITASAPTGLAGPAYLNGWIDWNRDGDFLDSGEQVAVNLRDDGSGEDVLFNDGQINFAVAVPASALAGQPYVSRFRLSTQPDLKPDRGVAPDGEIEDHVFTVAAYEPPGGLPPGSCFAPNLIWNGDFATPSANWAFGYVTAPASAGVSIGLRTLVNPAPLTDAPLFKNGLGVALVGVDNEGNLDGVPDLLLRNDGLVRLDAGQTYVFSYDVARRPNSASVDVRLEWVLLDPVTSAVVATIPSSSHIVASSSPASWETRSSTFVSTAPTGDYKLGMTFRPSTTGTGDARDLYLDRVYLGRFHTCDFGDAPADYGLASHALQGDLKLGARAPDAELSPHHSADALGDDVNGLADEDGVSVLPPLYAGETSYSLPAANVSAAGTGTLQAWIDFDRNGAFAADERAFVSVTNGVLAGPLVWTDAPPAVAGLSYARFRFASTALADDPATADIDEGATDFAFDGEAEDRALSITVLAALPPDAGMAVCSAPAGLSGYGTWPVGWNHNSPRYTLEADGRWPNLPVGVQTYGSLGEEIASAAALVFGPGISYATAGNSAFSIGDAEAMDAAQAYADQDYISYSFTTAASLKLGSYLRRFSVFRQSGFADQAPFRFTLLLSTDPNFSSASVLVDGYSPAQGRSVLSSHPVFLAPATTYHLRAVFHEVASSSGLAFWDDLLLDVALCADRSDAPASYSEAYHLESPALMRLGATRNPDPASIASPDAMGDGATDDGVFLGAMAGGVSLQGATLVQGEPQILEFAVAGAGRLSGWIDGNRDGAFSLGVETLFSDVMDNGPGDENPAPGAIRVTIAPPALVEGASFARFRWSSAPRLGPVGPAPDGEVEDYAVSLLGGDLRFTLTPNHESVVEAGQLALYPHRVLVGAGLNGGALSFDLESERSLEWVLLRDDGDRVYGAGDLPWVQGAPISAGDHLFWLVAKTPQDAPGGWSDLTRITAQLLKDAQIRSAEVSDLTRIGGEGSGSVFARKLQALDSNCDGAPDAGEASFTTQTLSIAQGGCVVYRIRFENRSVDPIRHVRIHDHTPSWMVYLGGSAQVRTPPSGGLTFLLLNAPAAAAEGPISFSFVGNLQPGEGGEAQFAARLFPVVPPSGGGEKEPGDDSGDDGGN